MRPRPDLSDYALPEKPVRCRCVKEFRPGTFTFPDEDCLICQGTGYRRCVHIGLTGCEGYAVHAIEEPGFDDVCAFHADHHWCGARLFRTDQDALCTVCDRKEIARLWPDGPVVGSAA